MDSNVTSSVTDSAISDTMKQLESVTETRLEQVFEGSGLSTPESVVESQISTPSELSSIESVVSTQESSLAESIESTQLSSLAESVVSTQTADKINLPDAYYRAALHQGYSDEDIKNLLNKDPELAKRIFAKAYETTNALSQEFAAIGRAKQKVEEPIKKEPKKKDTSEFKELDIKELRKQYDNDPIIELLAQQQEQNKQLFDIVNKQQPQINESQAVDEQQLRIQIQEEALLGQQMDQFFKSDNLKLYNDFYGKATDNNWENLTVGQRTKRYEVIEEADAICRGYEAQGRTITVDKAMELAHLRICKPFIEQAIRDDIKAKVVKRSKSLSLKPTSAKATENKKPQTQADLIAATEERLAKVFK